VDTVYTSTDFQGNEVPYTIIEPTTVRPDGFVDNTPGNFTEQRQYSDSSPMGTGGPAIMQNGDGTSVDLGFDLAPSVAGGRGTIVPAQPSNYTSFEDMFDGGGKGTSGDTYSGGGAVSDLGNSLTTDVDLPGNAVSRALNIGAGKKDSSSDSGYSGSSGDGTVMCTAYCEMGYLPKEIWKLDRRYGVKMYRNDPELIEGYHMWGVPVANYLRKQTFGAKVLRAVMWPIVKAWAEEMAHNMKPKDYKPNYFGKLIKFTGEPFSRMCGKLKSRKIEEMV
jgi:hypothetical protein